MHWCYRSNLASRPSLQAFSYLLLGLGPSIWRKLDIPACLSHSFFVKMVDKIDSILVHSVSRYTYITYVDVIQNILSPDFKFM